MLQIIIPGGEYYNEQTNEFVYVREKTLYLEHSLISISKWEAKWEKPFFDKKEKSYEEGIDYIRCMTITKDVDPKDYYRIDKNTIDKINQYIDSKRSATWFNEQQKFSRGVEKVVTSEVIYSWMIALNIPVQFEQWHVNRLITLIRICNIQNSPKKKRKKSELASQYRSLNAERRAKMNTRG